MSKSLVQNILSIFPVVPVYTCRDFRDGGKTKNRLYPSMCYRGKTKNRLYPSMCYNNITSSSISSSVAAVTLLIHLQGGLVKFD
jgi:hypothetical protein